MKKIALVLLLCACKPEEIITPDPVSLTEDALSHFCQMNVLNHGGPKAQIHLEGYPIPLFFAQVRDAVAYVKAEERDADITAIYVSDMADAKSWDEPGIDNWTNARDAHFVVGAEVRGGMGAPELVPFSSQTEAGAFVAKYGGSVVALVDIPANAAIGAIDLNAPLEDPVWPLLN